MENGSNGNTFLDKVKEVANTSRERTELNERESFVYLKIRENILKRAERGFKNLSFNLFVEHKLSEKSIELIIGKLISEGFIVKRHGLVDGMRGIPVIYISWDETEEYVSSPVNMDGEEDIEVIDISDLNF